MKISAPQDPLTLSRDDICPKDLVECDDSVHEAQIQTSESCLMPLIKSWNAMKNNLHQKECQTDDCRVLEKVNLNNSFMQTDDGDDDLPIPTRK